MNMQVSNVTTDDGMQLAVIITALNKARFDGVTGSDLDKLHKAKVWLGRLGQAVAAQLKDVAPTAPTTPSGASTPADSGGFKIKAMGPIPGMTSSKSNRKKK